MRILAVTSMIAALGCGSNTPEGLPPATEWQAGDPGLPQADPLPRGGGGNPHGGGGDPHAGMAGGGRGGADPHAGVPGAPPLGGGGGADPHAGVPGAPHLGDPNNAHNGVAAAIDVTQLGLSSPDPNRPIDPSRYIKGKLEIAPAVKAKVPPGAVVYLMVRKPGTNGKPGPLIAVDKLALSGDGQAFELTEKNLMVQGSPDLVGDLVLSARVDQDEDALTKQPGDVVGTQPVKVPAQNVVLKLDTVL
jgi:hypothetical protein